MGRSVEKGKSNAASVLTFTTAAGGVCKSIQIWNESDYL